MPTRRSNSSRKPEAENGKNGDYVEVDKIGEVDEDEVEQLEEIDLSSDEEDSDDECALIVLKRPPVTERTVEEVEVSCSYIIHRKISLKMIINRSWRTMT